VCRLDDSDADAAAAAGDGDADESGGARVERCTSARDSPLMPSDESLSPYTSSSSAELSLSARRGPQDSALQAMVRLSPLRCSAQALSGRGRGLSVLTVVLICDSPGTEERSSGAQSEAGANAACVRRELAPRQHGDASSHQVRTNAQLSPSLRLECSLPLMCVGVMWSAPVGRRIGTTQRWVHKQSGLQHLRPHSTYVSLPAFHSYALSTLVCGPLFLYSQLICLPGNTVGS
jgi:hypothetical protein